MADLLLSSLDGTNGFQINATATGQAGFSVASAGDVNGDGIDDLIIGAAFASPNGTASGAAYVVFGRLDAGFQSTFDLAGLDGTNGFRINGQAAGDWAGYSVAAAGDLNSDGIGDLIIGAPRANANDAGASYVVFGRDSVVAGAFQATLELSGLNGANGFRLTGLLAGDWAGSGVGAAGDINGDGLDDIVIGAIHAQRDGGFTLLNQGAAYVVFGRDTAATGNFAASFALSGLNGANGFRVTGSQTDTYGYAGHAVTSAGDLNGDGFGDLLVGSFGGFLHGFNTGFAYVVYGRDTAATTNFTAQLAAADITGSAGFRIDGEAGGGRFGYSAAALGDINGDGVDDVAISAFGLSASAPQAGGAYVIFGRNTAAAGAFPGRWEVSVLDGTNGFQINGLAAGDYTGFSVASAGDFNGDGLGDLLIGAHFADAGGSNAGATYVVYGRSTAFTANLNLSAMSESQGFRIVGETADDRSGFSVSRGGDLNGDGADDLLVGAPEANGGAGATYVLLGETPPLTIVGGAGDDNRSGGRGADKLYGLGGRDILRGLAGADLIDGGDMSDQLFGGASADTLIGGQGGDLMWGGAGADALDGGSEGDKLWGEDGNDALTGGDGNDLMYGGAGIDTLTGGAGADTLDGGGQADLLIGGAGNDIYIIDNGGVTITEGLDEGYDIVRASISLGLTDNIEALQLQGSADLDGTGNGLANNLQGNSGANTLDGGAGVDTINGNDGDDIVVGGLGNDLLRGGLGADVFVVAHLATGAVETDQIYDFSTAEDDSLDLSGAYGGTLSLVSAFTKHAGEMTLTFAGGITTLRLDTTGDGKVDYQMKINGDVTADSAGWAL